MNDSTDSGRSGVRRFLGGLVPAVVVLGWCSGSWGQVIDPTLRPTSRSANCTVAGCHAETLEHKFQHGPTAVFDCRACHEDVDHEAHTFAIKTEGRGLCDFCHIDKSGTEGPVVHEPLAEGKCLGCHNPHGSNHRKMLNFDTMGELCVSCHTDTVHGQWLHEPVAEGDCTACHSPHTADHEKLLILEGRELCLSCHEETATHLASGASVHEPVATDCMECHVSHGSDHQGLLTQSGVDLCVSCHEEQLLAAQQAQFPHSAVLEDRACLNCHVPHASSSGSLQFADPIAACMACHSGAETEGDETEIAPVNPAAPVLAAPKGEEEEAPEPSEAPIVTELLGHLPVSHGPIGEGECAACHEVHGGSHSRLLVANYTENFYEQFSEEAYALCLSCHDRGMLIDDTTWTATQFRDNDRNLHAVHVKADQGRTCGACHNTHAGTTKGLVRESSPYGQWMLPLNFKLGDTGGSCSPGCHKPQQYDRGVLPEGLLLPGSGAADEAAGEADGE